MIIYVVQQTANGERTELTYLYMYILPSKNSCEINKGHLEMSSLLCSSEDGQNCIYCNFDTILSRN